MIIFVFVNDCRDEAHNVFLFFSTLVYENHLKDFGVIIYSALKIYFYLLNYYFRIH